jgi:hypothetical protein
MAYAQDPKPPDVTPQSGMIQAIGVFNILFGGVLLLCGMGCANAFLPSIVAQKMPRFDPKEAKKVLDEMHRIRINELKKLEQAASAPEEKARLKTEIEKVEANPPKVDENIDPAPINEGIAWFFRYTWFDVITGPILNLLLLISGIGLLLRQNWARVLAIVTAALKILRLVALCLLLVGFVIPKTGRMLEQMAGSELGKEFFKQAMEQNKARGANPAGPEPTPEMIAEVLRTFGYVYAFLLPCLGSIYPIIVLVLLTRPGARAATRSERYHDDDPFGGLPAGPGPAPDLAPP